MEQRFQIDGDPGRNTKRALEAVFNSKTENLEEIPQDIIKRVLFGEIFVFDQGSSDTDGTDGNLITNDVSQGNEAEVPEDTSENEAKSADNLNGGDTIFSGEKEQELSNTIKTLDTNYAATYYPWVRIVDRNTSRPVFVPPSVVLPGVISYTDQIAHEWFAPAGLNRGGLTTVLEAKTRLTHAERDDLYENRINPIASFPGQGVVVFGQKTLQSKPSALDRINVRRLLIALRNGDN
mgnify:CR=1 FL=1